MDFIVESKNKLYCGIDNGKDGALSFIDKDENIVHKIVMPTLGAKREYDLYTINQTLEHFKYSNDLIVFLEDCHIMPKNGGKQNFKTGEQFGMIKGILYANKIKFEIVSARNWQKQILKSMTKKESKTKSIQFCQQKYPNENFKRTEKCKKFHDGLTDATCIAIYGKRKY